ncbi:MAG: MerR family transcriptional regulator [Acidimicrobiales bacterium]
MATDQAGNDPGPGEAGVGVVAGHFPAGSTEGLAVTAGFSGPAACRIVGITYRQLDYWARTDLIRPSLADARGSGTQRRYSYRDLVELKVIKGLLDAGVSLQSARRAVDFLRINLGEEIANASLVLSGRSPLLVRSDGDLVDLVRQGQGVLSIVALAGVVEELHSAIRSLPTAPTAPTAERELITAPVGPDVAAAV